WEDSGQFDLQRFSSTQEMEHFLGGEDTAVLGLVLPPDFELQMNGEAYVQLDGYVDH
ncbi:MAG: hypothetical protein GWN58_15780, partial [Anaerolineae bacterium]|nr:hypothetical protein [Anaerolineae bacterium]